LQHYVLNKLIRLNNLKLKKRRFILKDRKKTSKSVLNLNKKLVKDE